MQRLVILILSIYQKPLFTKFGVPLRLESLCAGSREEGNTMAVFTSFW
jgi:hypothetical protein